MESDRHVPNTRFFAMRINFKPFPSLELGLSRVAQWCGNGRPCSLSTFGKLFTGRDNRGQAGITPENEPGNQQSGFDARWSTRLFDVAIALYGQYIGEDEFNSVYNHSIYRTGLRYRGRVIAHGTDNDSRNSLTPTRQDIVSLDLSHSRVFNYGQIDIGLGFEQWTISSLARAGMRCEPICNGGVRTSSCGQYWYNPAITAATWQIVE